MHSLLFFLLICSTLADEHWFVFDQHQFPGFRTPLFTLTSSASIDSDTQEQKNISFTLLTYDRSINVDITIGYSNGTHKSHEQPIKLNVQRADLLHNTFNHLIFVAVRQRTKLETYVNCKLIDSYLLYPTNPIEEKESDDEENIYTIEKSTDLVKHFYSASDEHYHQKIFDAFGCKQSSVSAIDTSQITTIGRPLLRKMQQVIDKVQQKKFRSRRDPGQSGLLNPSTDSLTIVYKPNLSPPDSTDSIFHSVVNIHKMAFEVRYYPRERLFHVRFNNENKTQFVLYADKTTDLLNTNSSTNPSSAIVLFLHITPTLISCYVNCELTDQEFVVDSAYVQTIIRQTINQQEYHEQHRFVEYHRQSTLVLYNKSIEHVASNFFCVKLDKKNEELLPDKYALRKFANALDMLVNSLESVMQNHQGCTGTGATTGATTTTTSNFASYNMKSISGFGSLIAPVSQTDPNSTSNEVIEYDKTCQNDHGCQSASTGMKCQHHHCTCPTRHFWSPLVRRCILCKDLSVGHRCFRLSNHKSTWYEANDFCQDESATDEQQEYTLKLAANMNRTDIELIKQSLLQEEDGEQLDYYYWIGLTSHFDTRKLHQQSRSKRRVPTTIFRWYDNGETAQLNMADIWCSQSDPSMSNPMSSNELCVSLTSCGLYADDCQRNYRFLCEAI